jgi:hypothetical protein
MVEELQNYPAFWFVVLCVAASLITLWVKRHDKNW